MAKLGPFPWDETFGAQSDVPGGPRESSSLWTEDRLHTFRVGDASGCSEPFGGCLFWKGFLVRPKGIRDLWTCPCVSGRFGDLWATEEMKSLAFSGHLHFPFFSQFWTCFFFCDSIKLKIIGLPDLSRVDVYFWPLVLIMILVCHFDFFIDL